MAGMFGLKKERLAEIAKERTEAVLAQLREGVVPWKKPWTPFGGPVNAVRGTAYRGGNQMWLSLLQQLSGYPTGRWLTLSQCNRLGGRLRKGEKQTLVVYWKPMAVRKKKEEEEESSDADGKLSHKAGRKWFKPYGHYVVNVAQCDGLPEKVTAPVASEVPFQPIERAEAFIGNLGLTISETEGENRAAYSPMMDAIIMPDRRGFNSEEEFYSTLLHECTHATGHASRCDRDLTGQFGSPAYAFEELVAELGASFAAQWVGMDAQLQHAEYIGHWIQRLEDDAEMLMRAAKLAERAVGWMVDKQPEDAKSAGEIVGANDGIELPERTPKAA